MEEEENQVIEQEECDHIHVFHIIPGSGKETGVPKWSCTYPGCDKIVESS